MEIVKQENNKIENPEKQERVVFVETIRKSVMDTFPFVSEDQKNIFNNKFKPIIENCGDLSEAELVRNIRLVLASLENTHTKLEEKWQVKYYLDKPIFYKAGKFWVEDNGSVLEVLSINGISIGDLVKEKMEERGGGTIDNKINWALRDLECSQTANSIVLEAKKENEVYALEVNFVVDRKSGIPMTSKRVVSGKMLDQETGYLQIKSWSGQVNFDGKNVADLVEEELASLKTSKFLIIDVRENGGGDSPLAEKLAGHFVKKGTHYGTVLKRQAGEDELIRSGLELEPQGDFLDKKKVVVLTGPRCLSSNEMFIMMMKDTGIAKTIGQTTGGGSGNPRSFEISLNGKTYTLKVSSWKMIRNNGNDLESVGIEPDLPVAITPEDVVNHRDVELEVAKKYFQEHRLD
ncbi:MAG: S41 family peptidase [Candidatus Vogelbacteria bacterium]|nr:S41 family peptidase [Candidatus Vogelbacteria bacterium]